MNPLDIIESFLLKLRAETFYCAQKDNCAFNYGALQVINHIIESIEHGRCDAFESMKRKINETTRINTTSIDAEENNA